jgi:hypothetical protein
MDDHGNEQQAVHMAGFLHAMTVNANHLENEHIQPDNSAVMAVVQVSLEGI